MPTFQNITLITLINQFTEALEKVKKQISNIPDEKALNQLKTNFNFLKINKTNIEAQLNKGEDPNCSALRDQYKPACIEFEANQNSWDSIIKNEEAKYQKKYDTQKENERQSINISEEQQQLTQQTDEINYIDSQLQKIVEQQKNLKEIADNLNNIITEDHTKVVKIDDNVENAKNNMQKGNKELDKAEEDQKKCNIF